MDIAPLSPTTLAKDEREAIQHNFWTRKALALDYFLNVWLFNGRLDETISSHSARAAEEGKLWGHLMVRFLNLFDSNHGVHAQAGDLARAEVIVALEESAIPKS